MDIPGEEDERVVDGVGFLRRVNAGERPTLPESVVVVGGGDVAMDACRAALRLPGCREVKVVYRRGAEDIPARAIELEGAIKEGVEFVYNTQQVSVSADAERLRLHCVKTAAGPADEDGRRRPVVVADSEHEIECGMVIAAVGQYGASDELSSHGLMADDRVRTEWEGMRTADPQVFAAGDGAFGGSTIVMAMHHGQRAAYYLRAFLDGHDDPLPYRTPYRTRQVPVAQDIMWERFAPQHPTFFGLGEKPVEFPEIESTYDWDTAKAEASRCYRCDAETGSPDYSVRHREDIFSMARTNPADHDKLAAMLRRRLTLRDNPFAEDRAPSLDDLVFLPANLSRLVIDPYREPCKVSVSLSGSLELPHPFLIGGFDGAPREITAAVKTGADQAQAMIISATRPDSGLWMQLVGDNHEPHADAQALIFTPDSLKAGTACHQSQARGILITPSDTQNEALQLALDETVDFAVLDLCDALSHPDALNREVGNGPRIDLLRDAVRYLRAQNREEAFTIIVAGGVRSGTDAAKLIGLGANIVVLGMAAGFAVGAEIDDDGVAFRADRAAAERADGLKNIVTASIGEASMMARCCGKTQLQNIEPEDLRAVTIASSEASGIPLVGLDP